MSDDKTNKQKKDALKKKAAKKKAAKKKAAAKPPASKSPDKPDDQVAILFVKCKKDHFMRAGIRWVKDGFGVLVSELSDDQIDAIMSEPMLVVEEGSINADALDGIVRVNQD